MGVNFVGFLGVSLFLSSWQGFCACKCASVKMGKAKIRKKLQEICKSARFLSRNWKKWVLFEHV